MMKNGEEPTALVVGMAAFEPAPNGFVPKVGAEMDVPADIGDVADGEAAPSA
jgi:hypothetical protein